MTDDELTWANNDPGDPRTFLALLVVLTNEIAGIQRLIATLPDTPEAVIFTTRAWDERNDDEDIDILRSAVHLIGERRKALNRLARRSDRGW